jgi:hypothetical protein
MESRICLERDILYACRAYLQQEDESNEQPNNKKSRNQTRQRITRPSRPRITKRKINPWIWNNHKHQTKLRSLLWPKHRLPTARRTRKERNHQKRMGPNPRPTTKSLLPNIRRTKPTNRRRRITIPNMQQTQRIRNEPPTIQPTRSTQNKPTNNATINSHNKTCEYPLSLWLLKKQKSTQRHPNFVLSRF